MKRLWTVAALLGCVFPSYADVSGLYVEYYSLSNPHDHWAAVAGFPDRHLSQAGLPSESNIALTNLTSQVYRIVAATPSTTDVGATTIACASPTSTPSILIAGSINSPVNLITRSGTRPAAAVRSLQGVSCSSGRPKLQISASGSIFGVIDMYDIARINIGGSLGTSCVITHDPIYDSELGPWPEIGEITCAYAFTGSSIVLVHGGLGYIESLGQLGSSIWVGKGDIGGIRAITISETLRGAIRGDITTELGGIENIEADYEIGGANGSIINIKTKNGINNIFGSGIRANIIANAFGGSGNIGRIQTTNVIAGQIAAQTLTKVGDDPAIAILSGNLDADITLQGDLASKIVIAGELNPTRTIKVYGDIVSGGSVTVGVGGLKGQVIINGSGGSNTWDGSIKVGPDGDPGQIVLAPPTSAPYYSRTPAELGGGAVGLAPFHVHPAGSTITNGGYYFRPGSPTDALPNPFRIRHYGLFQMASTPKVQVRDPYNASVWGDVTHLFTVVRENDPNSTLPRTLKITYMGRNGVPIPPGRYRVHVEEGDLLCQQVGVGDVSVTPYDYFFNVTLDCNSSLAPDSGDFLMNPHTYDCDLNGVMDSCEVVIDQEFRDMDDNGVLDTCEAPTGACRCDFNGDELLNSSDFFAYLNCYFSGSPIACGADFNQDGLFNSQDFFDWLMCFFSGC